MISIVRWRLCRSSVATQFHGLARTYETHSAVSLSSQD
jgi:hypothetical protein